MNGEPGTDQVTETTAPAWLWGLVSTMLRWVETTVRHWLAVLNVLVLIYVGVPFLAPVFAAAGLDGPARLIYLVYSPACHQLPERSYFLFGESMVYDRIDLPANGVADSDNLLIRRRYIGDDDHGYKVALCQRDVAIYGSMFIMGLVFALRKMRLPRLSWRLYLLFLIPIALDGGTQLLGLRTSTWQLRTLTGILFGMATIWLAYPYVADSMPAESFQISSQSEL